MSPMAWTGDEEPKHRPARNSSSTSNRAHKGGESLDLRELSASDWLALNSKPDITVGSRISSRVAIPRGRSRRVLIFFRPSSLERIPELKFKYHDSNKKVSDEQVVL